MVLDKLKNGLFFRGWVYIALEFLIIIGLFILRRQNYPVAIASLAVAASGFLYAIGYIWISTSCDFRLHYWTVITALVSAVPLAYLIQLTIKSGWDNSALREK